MSSGNPSGSEHVTFGSEPGQRQSMAHLEPIDLQGQPGSGSAFTRDLTTGFEPKYRGSAQGSNGLDKKVKVSVADDPWAIQDMVVTTTPWSDLDSAGKVKRVGISVAKFLAVTTLLYFFVCSLDCLSQGFQLVGGETTSEIFDNSELMENPVVGVMIGILTTVLVQSSSTSTSIIVSMVSAGILEVKMAIPIIMGANIGTSITNTIVSLTQAGDRSQFRRAFAGATVHDMFNWLTVIVLLVVEVTTGYLFHVTELMMKSLFGDEGSSGSEVEFLSVLTDPFVDLIVKINKNTLECWSLENCTTTNTLLQQCAPSEPVRDFPRVSSDLPPASECNFLFAKLGLSDQISGAILLVCSLLVLCTCLILIVKVLQSVMQGQIANIIRKTLNAKIPYVPWLTGYLALGVGALVTFLVQSSSVFTSALTPLVGLGVISIERVYPLTLGSNIGTTTTALLAALASEGIKFRYSLQIALCHLLFNVTGILLFYPIPFMRFPIGMAKFLGDTTAKYRWFAIAYMILMFLVLPAVIMGLSIADPSGAAVITFAAIILLIFGTVTVVNFIRERRPSWLPDFLQSWKFLPLPLRSLEPYDRVFTSWSCCRKLKDKSVDPGDYENAGFDYEEPSSAPGKTNNLSLVQIDDLRPPKNGHSNPAFSE